jgi:hypothetical protein
MDLTMKRSLGEWGNAMVSSVCVGAAIAIVICGSIAVGSHLGLLAPSPFLMSGYVVGGLLGAGTAVHFLRLFSVGEIEPRDIWRSVGKAFLAFGDD